MSRKEKKPPGHKTRILLASLARSRGERPLAKRFLVVCEDGKSAPNYFKALRTHLHIPLQFVMVSGSGGRTQPIQVVQEAVQLSKDAATENAGTEPFDYVWCVIDGDFGNKINAARNLAKQKGIELAISTKCFEYWILLHFEENDTSSKNCNDVIRTLKRKHFPVYKKGKCDFSQIVINVREACARAKKLRAPGIMRGDAPENQNPCSELYKLIEQILDSQKG